MRRRSLLITLLALSAAHPLYAQNWMGRYIQERRQRAEERRATSLKEEMDRKARLAREEEEARNAKQATKAETVEATAAVETGQPIDTNSEVQPAQLSRQEIPTPPPAAASAVAPAPVEAEVEVRRALPPDRTRQAAAEVGVVRPAEPVAPAPTPTPAQKGDPYSRRYRVEKLDRTERRTTSIGDPREAARKRPTASAPQEQRPLTPFFPPASRPEATPQAEATTTDHLTEATPSSSVAPAAVEPEMEVRRAERAPRPAAVPVEPANVPTHEAPEIAPAAPAPQPPARTVQAPSEQAPAEAPARTEAPQAPQTPRVARETTEGSPETPAAQAATATEAAENGAEAPATAQHREPPKETTPEQAIGNYSSRELDPDTTEIRLSPDAASVPADLVQIQQANHYYAKKEYALAVPEYERYLSLYPTGSERATAFFRLAECYRQAGSFNAARKNYEALIYTIQMGDFIGPASYRLAEICYREEDYSGAASFFRKASVWVKDPAIVLSAKFYAARSLEKLKFTSDAIQAYEDILREQENNPFREASQLALVQLLNASGRRSQALLLLNSLRNETDKPSIKAEATVRIGLILLDQKLIEKAAKELESALTMPEIGGWKEVAEVGLLRLFYGQGKFKEALALYDASSKEFSKAVEPEVLLIVANCYRQLNKFDEARALYERIAQVAPNSSYAKDAEYERLVALYGADSADLLPEIDTYLENHPEESDRRDQLTLMKAESFYKTKRYGIAAQLYESLEQSTLTPALKAEALFKRGWSYAQVGDNAAAIQSFSAFLSGNPLHKLAVTALAQRAFCYEQVKNYTAALSDFNDLLLHHPKAKEREFALQHKALILGQQDENRAMVETFNLLLKEYPKSKAAGQAYYWIGLTAFQAKNYKDAVEPLKAARAKDKEFADRASSRILAALFYLEDREALAKEIDSTGAATKVAPEILRWLAGAFLKAQAPDRAETYLSKLVALPSDENTAPEPNDWLDLGRARTQLQKWKEAEAAIEAYLKLATEPTPRANGFIILGQAQLGAAEYDAAQKSANSALELQPEGRLNALGRMLSGDISIAKKEYEAGAKHYMSVALVYDDPVVTPQALEKAHKAYQLAGDETQAAKVLNSLRSRFPEYKVGMLK